MLPVLCREAVDGEHDIAIFGQAFARFRLFDGGDFDERVERGEGILHGPGHPFVCVKFSNIHGMR